MKKNFLLPIFVVCSMLLLQFSTTSCRQDKRDYNITVRVVTPDNIPARNCLVSMFAPVERSEVDTYGYTDNNGEVSFSFKNKVFLEVHAVKGSWRKCDAVELDRGEQNFTMTIYPFEDPRQTCMQ